MCSCCTSLARARGEGEGEGVLVQGGWYRTRRTTLNAAIERVGDQLVRAGCLDRGDDVRWLEFDEVCAALERGAGAYQETVANRKIPAAPGDKGQGPATVGASRASTTDVDSCCPRSSILLGVTSPLSALAREQPDPD